PRNIPAGTPVTVKFSVPASLLGLLDNMEIGTFTGLHAVSQQITGGLAFLGTGPGNASGHNASSRDPEYTGTTLANALNGAGIIELTFTPDQLFHGVYLKLSGEALSVALN